MEWLIYKGEPTKADEAGLPVQSRAVAYGDGCFDTLRSYEGCFLKLEKHIDRLHSAMEYLGIGMTADLQKARIKDQIRQLIDRNDLWEDRASIRMQVWREGPLGYDPGTETGAGWAITANLLSDSAAKPVTLVEVPTRRIPADSLNGSFKLSNGINYIRARLEARERGGDDALMLTTEGLVSETTIANIFWIKNDIIYTPNLECDILPGITRGILASIIRELDGVQLAKGEYRPDKVYQSDAAWICNSLREVRPVKRIGNHPLDTDHPVFDRLYEAMEAYKKRHLVSIKES